MEPGDPAPAPAEAAAPSDPASSPAAPSPPAAPPSAPTEAQALEARALAFQQHLARFTRRTWVTYALVAANVAVFLAMLGAGADLMSPDAAALLRFGANYGPRTTSGEWWRLLTNTFVHIGLIHLAFNMVVLLQIGVFVERLIGNLGFLLLYLATGVLGSLASLAWNPSTISAGASGAVFGCYGVFVAALVRNRGVIPAPVQRRLLRGAGMFILYNVVYGSLQANIDQLAHLGGLVSGFVLGLVAAVPLTDDAMARRTPRALAAFAIGCVLAVAGALAVPRAGDWLAELSAVDATEKRLNEGIKAKVAEAQAGKLDDAAFVAYLRDEVVPAWRAERDRVAAITGLRGKQLELRDAIVHYMDVKGQAWGAIVEGIDKKDAKKIQEGKALMESADQIAKSFGDKH